jgi:polyisoprenoid-binding protein YceI
LCICQTWQVLFFHDLLFFATVEKYLLQRIFPSRIQRAGRSNTMSTTLANPVSTTTWKLDPAHSSAEFKVKHMMISNVKGSFPGLSGVLTLNETDHIISGVEASVDVAGINTGDAQRDGHLKSADFFDVEKFPTMTFKSNSVQAKGGGAFAVSGDLTLHGVTRPVTFAFDEVSEPSKDHWGNLRIGLSAATRINRKDFGLTWNSALETGGMLVGEEVAIHLDIQFIKA